MNAIFDSHIKLEKVTLETLPILKNLARFYVYELSKYDDNLIRSKIPDTGLYEAYEESFHFNKYCTGSDYHAMLIRVDQELAGFVVVNNISTESEIEWDMAEFFILGKFQRNRLGSKVANSIFEQFKGKWQVRQMKHNTPAINFWRRVISEYTSGHYVESIKAFAKPHKHDMNILIFNNS